MARARFPHEELVQELRQLLSNMPSTTSISDDMDQYYVEAAGYSPMERIMEDRSRRRRHAETISERLVNIGAPAADAVALGLRMQGSWREYLLPYLRAHGKTKIVSEAVKLIQNRRHDPLKSLL